MDLIPRDGVVEIVAHRDRAVELYAAAFEKIRAADEAIKAAEAEVRAACGGSVPDRYVGTKAEEVAAFREAVRLPDADQYGRVARRLTDIAVWHALIERTDLDHLMDKQAKDELRAQMEYVPEEVDRRTGQVINQQEIDRGLPPVTVEVVEETLRGLVQDSGVIFRRGIANAFSQLDRRFRSHDGFKVGSRVVLSHAFDDWGWWNHYQNHRDTLVDIERVFLVLDGKGPRASYAGIVGTIDAERKGGSGQRQTEHRGDYFRVRIFKNGNAHLWFERPDLVRGVNRLLAEHYGEVVADGKDRPADPEEVVENGRAVGHAKDFGFFPTPKAVAERVIEAADMWRRDGDPPLRCLEPSAGTGRLARLMREAGGSVDVVEVQADLVHNLRAGGYARVLHGDFLQMIPAQGDGYDRIVMNPPWNRQRDIDHVAHALKFLKPGGILVAVMSAGTEFRENAKARAFRELMEQHRAEWRDLPTNSFAESGTYANALYVKVRKPSSS